MGGVIDLQVIRRSAAQPVPRPDDTVTTGAEYATEKLRDRRVYLKQVFTALCQPDGHPPCSAPRPCAGHEAVDQLLDVAASAEEQLVAVQAQTARDRTMVARLARATREIGALEKASELIAAIPALALHICPGAGAALLEVGRDGAVEVLASSGAPLHLPLSRIGGEAQVALGETSAVRNGAAGDREAEPRVRRVARMAIVPVVQGPPGMALVVDEATASAALGADDIEHLAVYAAVAGSALARARAAEALCAAAARDAATLQAIRDGVVAVDHDGTVQALNVAAAELLGVRREDALGRRLRDLPGLSAVAAALATAPTQWMNVVAGPRGEIVLRSQGYDGGVVTTLRDAATERNIAQRMVGSVARYTFDHLVGAAPALLRVIDDAKRAAASDVPILICGESGTGKEMLAQAIHNASARAAGPFVGMNVTAIPRELLESELFGYEGGTFTGARSSGRAGKFELVGSGTLLLDEIGDMPFEMQSKLLRVLQERVIQRLGSARDIRVRARIVATTHRDLSEAVQLGRFRLDLFHRLRVLELRLPPLRERKEDVPLLVDHQLRLHAERTGRRVGVAPPLSAALQAYDWPGNVRELVNVLEGELSLLPPGGDLLTRIPPVLLEAHGLRAPAPAGAPELLSLAELERRACEHTLKVFDGNVARAARALGVAKGTLYSKMKRYRIGEGEALAAPTQESSPS